MPSASAKLEKQASNEASDPIKQIVTMVEKKVRNLEKRKAKLDAYKTDSQNGKELNEDQKNAVKKYDQVVEVLDFAKEMQKSFCGVIQESAKLQKKIAKRELLERQQQELHRIKNIFLIQDILNSMDGEDVRKDFLNGTNGAVKLTEDELNGLDELYKIVNVERNPEESKSEFEQHLFTAAEHMQGLLDSKQKEICGTSYKSLKETIMKVHSSGYFSKIEDDEPGDVTELNAVEPEHCEEVSPDMEEGGSAYTTEEYETLPNIAERIPQSLDENTVLMQQAGVTPVISDKAFYQTDKTPLVYSEQTRPVQDVLSVQGNLNFLQESQIGVESHMDPAAVVAHPVLPPGIPYPGAQYPTQQQTSASQVLSTHHQQQKPGEGASPAMTGQHLTPTRMISSAPAQSSVQQPVSIPNNISVSQSMQMQNPVNQAPDFDPAGPIPTQTYTNQNFSSAIHPMMANAVTPNFASVTLAHAPLPPQHIVSSGLVPRSTVAPPVVSDQSAMPMTAHSQSSGGLPSTTSLCQVNAQETKEHFAASREYQMAQQQRPLDRESPQSVQQSLIKASSQFERGDAGYQNATNTTSFCGRESYVDSTSYSSNLKRGLNSRGGAVPRGSSAQRGGGVASRGSRSSYRNQ